MRFVLNIECDNEAFFGRLNMTPTTRPQRRCFDCFDANFPSCWGDEAPVFGQQVLPRLWHDRLEAQNFFDDSCVDLVLSSK
jgi:hypothetical protein